MLMAFWLASFFMPALSDGPSIHETGFGATELSLLALFIAISSHFKPAAELHLGAVLFYYGALWVVNLLVLLAPVALRRAEKGKGGILIGLLAVWDVLILAYACLPHPEDFSPKAIPWRYGYVVWVASIVGITLLLLWARISVRRALAVEISSPAGIGESQ
jgi:hypothetical protein